VYQRQSYGQSSYGRLLICNIPVKVDNEKKRWSTSSLSVWQKGHRGPRFMPRLHNVSFVGSNAWQSCHRKNFHFGIMLSFQIQLYSHIGGLSGLTPWAAQVTELVENSPLPDNLQHAESKIGLYGIGTAKISWRQTWPSIGWSVSMFHSLLSLMKPDTLKEVSIREWSVILSKLAKLSLAHQLSSQKLILSPFPTF